MNGTIIVLIILAVVVVGVIAMYNSLVKLRIKAENGWAQIDTQLQRRYDLIPNLVETVKGYAAHEKEVFENVTAARAGLAKAGSVAEKATADNMLTDTVKSLFAVAENYPQLRANENFKELQVELTGTENKISYARQFYNDTVAEYNQAIAVFPKSLIAGIFGFKAKEYYEAMPESAQPVKVQF